MQNPLALSPRRAATVVIVLALLLAGVLVFGNAAGAGARSVPHLAMLRAHPVTVSGRGFKARTRIRLVLMADGTMTRRPLTSRHGTFSQTFPTTIDRCSGWSVTATQPGRAPIVLRSPAKPECAPLRAP